MDQRLRNCFLNRSSDSCRSLLTQVRVPCLSSVIFILLTASGHTESLPLTNKQEFLPNRVRNKLAPMPLINEPVEISADLFGKCNVRATCARE
jgi:hypothetical protein